MMVPKQLVILLIYIRPAIRIYWLICLLLPLLGCTQEVGPGNLALNKAYTLSVSPNYPRTMGNDLRDLTDGKFRTGAGFWTHSAAVGWQDVQTVAIEVDLEATKNIDRVGIHTARGFSAKVMYPNNALIFLSDDKKDYYYAGDAMLNRENTIGSYQVKSFFLNNIAYSARYIKIILRANSGYIFLDEIMVYSNDGVQFKTLSKNASLKSTNFTQQLTANVNKSISIKKNIFKIKESLNILSGTTLASSYQKSWQSFNLNDSQKINQFKEDLNKSVIEETSKRFRNQSFLIKERSPWASWFPSPLLELQNKETNYSFTGPNDAYAYGAFEIVNAMNIQQTIPITTTLSGVSFFYVPRSPGIDNYVYDALIPLKGNIVLDPGEHKFVFFKILIKGKVKGKFVLGRNNDISIPISIDSYSMSNKSLRINAGVWGYLDYPFVKDHKEEVVKDLFTHGVNVINSDRRNIPKIGDVNFDKLLVNLKRYPLSKDSKIVLFYNWGNSNSRKDIFGNAFMSKLWKSNFKSWYRSLLSSLNKLGLNSSQVYFQPFDEIKESEIDDYIQFSTWAKQNIAEANLYLTINSKSGLKAIPYTDIAQIVTTYASLAKTRYPNNEVWSYQAFRFSRELNPYTDYRLYAWSAFQDGLKGIGFWNYLDLNRQNKLNNYADFVEFPANDYSVVYTGENEVHSSRRWEAFSRGITDYTILSYYTGFKGQKAVKNIVLKVLNNLNDTQQAENALIEIKNK